MIKMKYTQVELPGLHLVWDDIVSSVIRTNYQKPGLTFIPSIVQQAGLCEVEAVDMKIRDQDVTVPYKRFRYGDGIMTASRIGVPFEKVEQKIRETDILGISLNSTSWADIALDFMKYAKRVNPKVITVIGGNEAAFRHGYYLESGLVDIAVRGEAEYTLPGLIECLRERKDLEGVRGISFLGKNRIITTPRPAVVNMDEIPLPSLGILKEDMQLWTTPIECFPLPEGVSTPISWIFLTRGCYQNCEYCTTPAKMGEFRHKGLERIAEELRHIKSYGIKTLNIWDDSLTSILSNASLGRRAGREYLIEIAGLLRGMGFAYEFSQGVVIRDLWDMEKNQPDFELINAFYSNKKIDGSFAGCYGEYFPVECLQEEKRYQKLMTFDKEKTVLEAIVDAGTKLITYSSIMGGKKDTLADFEFATKRLRELNELVESRGGKALATPFIHSIFPGSRIWVEYQENLVYPIGEFPELYQLNTAPYRTESFEPHEITLAKKEMEKRLMTPEQYARWNKTGRYQWK